MTEIEDLYDKLWDKEEQMKEKEIQEQVVAKLPRGKPREGLNGKYLRRQK